MKEQYGHQYNPHRVTGAKWHITECHCRQESWCVESRLLPCIYTGSTLIAMELWFLGLKSSLKSLSKSIAKVCTYIYYKSHDFCED